MESLKMATSLVSVICKTYWLKKMKDLTRTMWKMTWFQAWGSSLLTIWNLLGKSLKLQQIRKAKEGALNYLAMILS